MSNFWTWPFGSKKKGNKYTQAQVDKITRDRVRQARNLWSSAVRSWDAELPVLSDMMRPTLSSIQDLGGQSWKRSNLYDISRMMSRAESNKMALDSAIATPFDDSMAPNRADFGNVMLPTVSGNEYETNIFTNPNLSGWQGPNPSSGPDVVAELTPYLNTVQSNINTLGKWRSNRQTEEDRYNTFREQLRGDVGDITSQSYGLSINQGDEIGESIGRAGELQSRISSFKTPLKNFADFSWSTDQLNRANERLSGLQTKRDDELSRVGAAKADFASRIGGAESALGGYTIADEAGMKTLSDTLRKLGRDVGSFNTQLTGEYDSAGYLGDVEDITANLRSLEQDRRDELNRISSDTARLTGQGSSLGSMARRMGTYDLATIQDAQDLVSEGLGEISGYSSPLDYTGISNLQSDYTGYGNTFSDLLTKRAEELDQYETDLADYGTELTGLDLWEERKMRDLATRLNRQAGDLGRYTGGRVPDIMADYQQGDADILARLTQLDDKRDEFETQAANYLNEARGGFYTTGDLDTMQANYDSLYEDVQKYGADQAQDELTALSEAIRNEEARFAMEQAARKKQEDEEAARVASGNNFMYGLGDRALTPAEYAALISKRRRNDPSAQQGLLSSLLS